MTLPAAMALRLEDHAVQPAARVGVIGAGQLARMLHEAAVPLNVEVRVLTEDLGACAVRAGAVPVLGSDQDLDDLRALAAGCDVVTFEHELADLSLVDELASEVPVRPSARATRTAQDKLHGRRALQAGGFPCPRFRPVYDLEDIHGFMLEIEGPAVLKARSGGEGGRSVWMIDDAASAKRAWDEAFARRLNVLVEERVAIRSEVSVLVARSPNGQRVAYPVLETRHVDGTCHEVHLPAQVGDDQAAQAVELGLHLAEALDVAGVLAVELFITDDGMLVNELSLRPHNSGHVTIEACATSQFQQHLRAILGWPLGSPRLVAPCAVMVNVFGNDAGGDPSHQLPSALAVPEVYPHLYGKLAQSGRKLGHVTALGERREEVLARARAATAVLRR
ncbi:MAG: 5-(carboxyamino)imidazole ribonucleotide synthase [Solirubrobacteraceae bacterium]|nr:5-(carboxyamino)imidazole ribonucleotide synthase [Solirubrobacteraceae bacterium]